MRCALSLLAWTDCHSTLSAILQNDRIDDLATLHAALSAVVRQILAPLGDHESAAARTTVRAVDSCPISSRSLSRLLLCNRQCRTHRSLPQRSIDLSHAIHNEDEWQLAFQNSSHTAWIIDVAEIIGGCASFFGGLCRGKNDVPRIICRSDGTVPKDRRWPGAFMEAG